MNKATPLAALTVGQFEEVFIELFEKYVINPSQSHSKDKEYVYGLWGIKDLFGVSHVTAQRYKDTILKDAVKQCGRKIIVDKQMAIELFDSYKKY